MRHIAGDSCLFQERYENKHRNKDMQEEGWKKQREIGRSKQIDKQKQTDSVVLVRKRSIPTERPPLDGKVSVNFSG
jgi:hypothetical protein